MPMRKSSPRRQEFVQALNHAMREAGGLGTIFSLEVARRFGVSQTDLECIDLIALRGRVTAGELAEASGLTTGAVTGVIDRLERAGYARRERDADDRRRVYVRVEPKALALGGAHYGSLERAMNELIARYGDTELALLVDYFTRARTVMLKEIEKLKTSADRAQRTAASRSVRSRSPRP
jgi:DNA-binding MarR family transcriptional regulator